jgi:hypothetical protein
MEKKMKKKLFLLFMNIIFVPMLLIAADDGGQPGAFLRLGIGANAIGLGKSFTAVSEDATSIYWNSAALSFSKKRQVTAMFAKPFSEFDDISYNFIGYAMPVGSENKSAIGFGVVYLKVGDIPKRDNNAVLTGSYSDKEYAFLCSYSKKFLNNISFGVTAKYIEHKIDNENGSLIAFDLSGKYLFKDDFSFGFVLENMYSSEMKMDVEKEKLPVLFRSGIAYEILPNWFISSEIIYMERTDLNYAVGTEINVYKTIKFRTGYNDSTEEYSFGAGFGIKNVTLDYSFTTHSELGDSHRFSMNYAF